jgi:hypothetical protein
VANEIQVVERRPEGKDLRPTPERLYNRSFRDSFGTLASGRGMVTISWTSAV